MTGPVSVITKTLMSYYRNRRLFGPGSGLLGGPTRAPSSPFDRLVKAGPRTGRREIASAGDDRAAGRIAPVRNRRREEPSAPFDAPTSGARQVKSEDLADRHAHTPTVSMEAEIARLRALLAERDERDERSSTARPDSTDDEIERAKRRIERDARKDAERRTSSVLLSFIEVLDDLDRAIAAAREEDSDSAVLRGIELVRKRFVDKLARHEVTRAPARGEQFDPARHEAVAIVPVDTRERDGTIVEEMRAGYVKGADILRPAAVSVGRYRRPERVESARNGQGTDS